jgi:hypothetical protein
LISSRAGYALLMSHCENTTPGLSTVDISRYRAVAEERGLNEAETDAYFKEQAIQYIKTHKGDALRMYAYQLLNYFNFRNQLQTSSNASPLKDWIMLATYGPLLLLFVLRLCWLKRFPAKAFEWLLITLYISSDFFMALFFTRIRYRLPLDLLCIAVVAMFIARCGARRFRPSSISS